MTPAAEGSSAHDVPATRALRNPRRGAWTNGRIARAGTPAEVWEQPGTEVVARFLGRRAELSYEIVRHIPDGGRARRPAEEGAELEELPEVVPPLREAVQPVARVGPLPQLAADDELGEDQLPRRGGVGG